MDLPSFKKWANLNNSDKFSLFKKISNFLTQNLINRHDKIVMTFTFLCLINNAINPKMRKIVLTILSVFALLTMAMVNYSTKETHETTKKTTSKSLESNPFVVVELFTSQGCSSCPPADEILRGLAQKSNVFPLSFHVTYWNRLGWKDSFSQKIFDERQYEYGSRFALNGVYTPQIVINGTAEMVGSSKQKIDKIINENLSKISPYVIILSKDLKDKSLIINYKINKSAKSYDFNIALVEKDIVTKIQRGENEGRTLKHGNVVRYFKTIKMKENTEGPIEIPFLPTEKQTIIVYLQEPNLGAIVASAKL
jgi:hypothetical protein